MKKGYRVVQAGDLGSSEVQALDVPRVLVEANSYLVLSAEPDLVAWAPTLDEADTIARNLGRI